MSHYEITDNKARGLSTISVNGVLYDAREQPSSRPDIIAYFDEVTPETQSSLQVFVERLASLNPSKVEVDTGGIGRLALTYLQQHIGPRVVAMPKVPLRAVGTTLCPMIDEHRRIQLQASATDAGAFTSPR